MTHVMSSPVTSQQLVLMGTECGLPSAQGGTSSKQLPCDTLKGAICEIWLEFVMSKNIYVLFYRDACLRCQLAPALLPPTSQFFMKTGDSLISPVVSTLRCKLAISMAPILLIK